MQAIKCINLNCNLRLSCHHSNVEDPEEERIFNDDKPGTECIDFRLRGALGASSFTLSAGRAQRHNAHAPKAGSGTSGSQRQKLGLRWDPMVKRHIQGGVNINSRREGGGGLED